MMPQLAACLDPAQTDLICHWVRPPTRRACPPVAPLALVLAPTFLQRGGN